MVPRMSTRKMLLVLSPFLATAATAVACPPHQWILETFASGFWVVDHTDQSWSRYLEFLQVPKAAWPAEFHATDMHQYAFADTADPHTFVMNHTIPKTGFHLLFESDITGKWVHNPYPTVTPAGFDPHTAKVNLSTWRNALDDGPVGKSCTALRTDMPVVVKDPATGNQTEHVVVFWRELTSPTSLTVSLYVTDTEGHIEEPWKSNGLSLRYFRRAVQSFPDAKLRLNCSDTGIGDGTKFC